MEERWIQYQYLLSMNLVFPLALLVAFRAGKLRGLNEKTLDEKFADLAFDSVKEQICNRLQSAIYSWWMNSFILPHALGVFPVRTQHPQERDKEVATLLIGYFRSDLSRSMCIDAENTLFDRISSCLNIRCFSTSKRTLVCSSFLLIEFTKALLKRLYDWKESPDQWASSLWRKTKT